MDTLRRTLSAYGETEDRFVMDDTAYWHVEFYVTRERIKAPMEGASVIVVKSDGKQDTLYTDDKGMVAHEFDRKTGHTVRVLKKGFKTVDITLQPPRRKSIPRRSLSISAMPISPASAGWSAMRKARPCGTST